MSADLYAGLSNLTVAGSLALLGVLVTRDALRRWFGAQLAYAAWLVVPLTVLAVLLPAPVRPLATILKIVPADLAPTAATASVAAAVLDWRPWLLLAWGLGAVVLAAYFTWQQRRYLRGLGHLRTRGTCVVSADGACGPALVGAWRPRLVLPPDFATRYAAHERALILAHERVHLARGDTRTNAVVAVLRCLNWFNPLIHLAAARLRFDQELACDAAVIARFPHARRRYADAMLKTQLAAPSLLPAGCHWSSTHPLKERIAMLKQPLPTRARRFAGVALVAMLGFGGAYVAWAAQAPRPAAAAAALQVDAQLTIAVDGGAEKAVRLLNPLGAPFTVRSDDPDHPWDAEFVAQAVDGENIKLTARVHLDGRLIGEPLIVVEPGKPAWIELGPPDPHFRLEATLVLRDGSGDVESWLAVPEAGMEG